MTTPAYVEDLADVKCRNPQCTDPACSEILTLIPACHPGAKMHVEYVKAEGILYTRCGLCHDPVVAFRIAHRPH